MELDVVENARIRSFRRKLLVACCGGPLPEAYLLSIAGVALVGLTEEMRLSTTSSASSVSSPWSGCSWAGC